MSNSVIVISHYSYPGGSAASLRIHNMVEGLVANKRKVHVISPYFRPSRRSDKPQVDTSGIREYYVFPELKLPRLYSDFLYKSHVSRFMEDTVKAIISRESVDLVYIYDGTSYLYFNKVSKLIRHKKIPLTIDITESRDQNYQLDFFGKRKKSWKERISNLVLYPDYLMGKQIILPRANFFISISTLLRDYLTRFHRDIIVIPGFERFLPVRSLPDFSQRTKISFLYVGTLIDRDAPELLELLMIELMHYKNELEFKFIGRYDRIEKSKKIMEDWKNKFGNLVNSVGEVDEKEITDELSKSDVFILTRRDSYEERCAFPTRLAEYLALNKPVIVSAVGDIHLYLKDEQDTCYIESNANQRLSDKSKAQMIRLIKNKSFRDFIANNGYSKGVKHFDSIRNAGAILEMSEHETQLN